MPFSHAAKILFTSLTPKLPENKEFLDIFPLGCNYFFKWSYWIHLKNNPLLLDLVTIFFFNDEVIVKQMYCSSVKTWTLNQIVSVLSNLRMKTFRNWSEPLQKMYVLKWKCIKLDLRTFFFLFMKINNINSLMHELWKSWSWFFFFTNLFILLRNDFYFDINRRE